MQTNKPPTISDVAREAGVSPFTVSAVLNGARSNTRVSPATRERILASAKNLRYTPNAAARALARQCTRTIGVLFGVVRSATALSDNYASGVLDGIVAYAAEHHYDVMLYTENWGENVGEGRDCAHPADRFRSRRTDGIVVIAPLTDSEVLEDLAGIGGLPIVAVSSSPEHSQPLGVPSVDVDNGLGIALAVEHLLSLGHTRIAHLTGNENVYSVRARRAAFIAAMEKAGQPVPDTYVVPGTYDGASAPGALRYLLSLSERPTAIVAGNDNIAIAALRAAANLGISVPEDLSIVGFDDVPAAPLVTPALTTICQPLRAIGAAAAALLIEQVEEARRAVAPASPPPLRKSEPQLLAPQLIVRSSTAVPPSDSENNGNNLLSG